MERPLGQPKLVANSVRSHHGEVWPSDASGKLGLGIFLFNYVRVIFHALCSSLFSPSCYNEVMFFAMICHLKVYWVRFSAALSPIQF